MGLRVSGLGFGFKGDWGIILGLRVEDFRGSLLPLEDVVHFLLGPGPRDEDGFHHD